VSEIFPRQCPSPEFRFVEVLEATLPFARVVIYVVSSDWELEKNTPIGYVYRQNTVRPLLKTARIRRENRPRGRTPQEHKPMKNLMY